MELQTFMSVSMIMLLTALSVRVIMIILVLCGLRPWLSNCATRGVATM